MMRDLRAELLDKQRLHAAQQEEMGALEAAAAQPGEVDEMRSELDALRRAEALPASRLVHDEGERRGVIRRVRVQQRLLP